MVEGSDALHSQKHQSCRSMSQMSAAEHLVVSLSKGDVASIITHRMGSAVQPEQAAQAECTARPSCFSAQPPFPRTYNT